jgi:hypothetical protein
MRITAIRDIVAPIKSDIANAYIDFSTMTASVVAIVTDAVVDGKPVVGFGFNSNGRYAPQGLLRERFIPRLLSAQPEEIQGADGLIDPHRAWAAMMRNEKPGGHGERSVAVGVLDMALWDAVAKANRVPLWRLLADRYNGGEADATAWVYAAGGYYYPGKGLEGLQDEMRSYLDRGYSTVKMKVGLVPPSGGPRPHRGGAEVWAATGRSSASTSTAASTWRRRSHSAARRALLPALVRGAPGPARLPGPRGARHHLRPPLATGEICSPCRTPATSSATGASGPTGHFAVRPGPLLRARGIPAHPRDDAGPRLVARRCVPHGGHQFALNIAVGSALAATRATRTCSPPSAASPTMCPSRTAVSPCRISRASASRRRARSSP